MKDSRRGMSMKGTQWDKGTRGTRRDTRIRGTGWCTRRSNRIKGSLTPVTISQAPLQKSPPHNNLEQKFLQNANNYETLYPFFI